MIVNASLINRILLVLGFVGTFIAGFLSLAHQAGREIPCGPKGGCNDVLQHSTAYWFGFPVAFFGLLGYLALVGLAIIRSMKGVENTKPFAVAGFFISMVGGIMSLYLQYISFSVIQKWCYWCIASAVTMVLCWLFHAMLVQKVATGKEVSTGKKTDQKLFFVLPLVVAASLVVASSSLGAKSAPKIDVQSSEMSILMPADAHVFGDPKAPITVIEFADMFCPLCKRMTPSLKKFVKDHPGKVRIVYRHYPLAKLHKFAFVGAGIAEIAAEKGLFFDYMKLVMALDEQPDDAATLLDLAAQVGLDKAVVTKRLADTNDPIYDRIQRDRSDAGKIGVVSTPTFFVSVKGGPATYIDAK